MVGNIIFDWEKGTANLWEATKVVAIFSFMIEFTQLLFHLGTFQISDLTYNTLGGAVGGVIYYLGYSRRRKK